MASVYWIHLPEHSNIFSEGYIGVSTDVTTRIYEHHRLMRKGDHENSVLINVYKKYSNQLITDILINASEEYCYEIEEILRPRDHIGWNINKGGDKPPSQKGKKAWNKNKKFIWITNGLNDKAFYGLEIPHGWRKGRTQHHIRSWNKGQTKESNPIIKSIGEANSIHRRGKSPWNKGLKRDTTFLQTPTNGHTKASKYHR